jgi:hypothetical protein
VVCVSRHYARLCREYTGWPETKVATVPNALDVAQLDRPKLDGARFRLGIIGIVPSRKRLDLALDVLEELRREDDRYLLFVKSGMPWEHWWVWQNPAEREHYASVLRRVQRSPLLRGAVVFDDAGPDVAAWLRRVGFVLSTSDDESFHVAPAEGMASRAVPMLRHWPGAETIYDMRWIHRDPAEMAAAVTALADEDDWRAAGDDAHAQAAAAFNLTRVDPVYLTEAGGAVVVSDRASWAAAVTGRMGDPDPVMIGAFLSLGYPVGAATPYRGVRALGGDRSLRLADGRLVAAPARPEDVRPARPGAVAEALTEAVRPLGEADVPGPAAADWRRDYGEALAGFLRGYVLDHDETSPVFGILRRRAAERLLRPPQADRHGAWALATLAALLSGDWLNAREPAGQALLR